MNPQQRVAELSGEHLVVSSNKLFCQTYIMYREELNLKKSSIKYRMQSANHQEGKSKLQVKHNRKQDVALALQKHNGIMQRSRFIK